MKVVGFESPDDDDDLGRQPFENQAFTNKRPKCTIITNYRSYSSLKHVRYKTTTCLLTKSKNISYIKEIFLRFIGFTHPPPSLSAIFCRLSAWVAAFRVSCEPVSSSLWLANSIQTRVLIGWRCSMFYTDWLISFFQGALTQFGLCSKLQA